ncbi:MAG: hypothetical protein ACRD19_11525 [Terriglobia bacterium]
MTNSNRNAIHTAIAVNLDALSHRLSQASIQALSAAAAMAEGRANQAIGTVLDLQQTLPEIMALLNAAVALHRGKESA